MRTLACEPWVALPMGLDSVRWVTTSEWIPHADPPTGALVGAPYGARKCVRGHEKEEQEEEEGGGEERRGEGRRRRRRAAPSLQNEDPTPQEGWEL